MGYVGKLEEKYLAIRLRKRGFSYKQILKKVTVSKSTLSKWCRDVILSLEQRETLLNRKIKGAERGRLVAGINKQRKRMKEIEVLSNKGIKEVGKLSKRDRFMAGIALYAGEGGKKSLQFANSDPRIIEFMMGWFREFCKTPEDKFRGSIWIHDNLDPEKAKEYWSKLTRIPLDHFHKTYLAKNKVDSKKIRKNIHSFGVFSIKISNTKMHRKVLGWMSGVLAS